MTDEKMGEESRGGENNNSINEWEKNEQKTSVRHTFGQRRSLHFTFANGITIRFHCGVIECKHQ